MAGRILRACFVFQRVPFLISDPNLVQAYRQKNPACGKVWESGDGLEHLARDDPGKPASSCRSWGWQTAGSQLVQTGMFNG
jgi:hypothetical protein